MKLLSWALSDVGRKRDHNEDSFLIDEAHGLYAVADGMGGHQGGAQASRMAVDILQREILGAGDFEAAAKGILDADPTARYAMISGTLDTEAGGGDGRATGPVPVDGEAPAAPPPAATVLRAAARVAGRAIYDVAQAEARLSGMGTTLTSVLFSKGRACFAHVGDSRAFLYRDGRIEQVTQDHSWIAEQVKAGVLSEDEAKESRFRHIITRSVGFEREVDVDLFTMPVLPGDCFLMCSDGMSNYFDDIEELGRILSVTYYRKVPQLLVDLANDRGGDDNITVVLVYAANEP